MHSVTLEDIHRDPAVLDRALEQSEPVEILDHGKVAGTLFRLQPAWRALASEVSQFPEAWRTLERRT